MTRRLVLVALLIFTTVPPHSLAATRLAPRSDEAPAVTEQVAEALGHLPLAFEANEGQTDDRVHYVARGRGYAIFLTSDETVLALSGTAPADRRVLRLRFAGSTGRARFSAESPLEHRVNYMTGSDPSRWRTDIATF